MYTGKCIKARISLISWWRAANWSQGATTVTAIGFFLWAQLWPAAAGAKELAQKTRQEHAATAASHEPLNDALKAVKTTLNNLDTALSSKAKSKDARALSQGRAQLKALRGSLVDAGKDVLADFDRDLEHIKQQKLSSIIQQRHADALAKFKTGQREMLVHLDAIESAKDDAALQAKVKETKSWLDEQQIGRKHQRFDPKNLPFGAAQDSVRIPEVSAKELKDIFKGSKAKSHSHGVPTKDRKRQVTKRELAAIMERTTLAKYEVMSPRQYASSGAGLLGISAMTPPGPEYLAPNEDVQISQAIQDLAAQLHHNPVEIYNWVQNSIEFVPTYGSIQGSDVTLQTLKGNAFDTSSLLIALLRASNIPARYVYGTVQIPTDKVMNWLGAVSVSDAAQNLLGQGDVPNVGLVSGGQVVAIQMEHVWVEAFVDFYPSRGANNRAPDTWVPMDAAFKQYTYSDGMDLPTNVPLDSSAMLDGLVEGASFETEGRSVRGIRSTYAAEIGASYQEQVSNYVAEHNSSPTAGELFGAKRVLERSQAVLPAGLPYLVTAIGSRAGRIVDALRHYVTFRVLTDDGNELVLIRRSLPSLVMKSVSLSFRPTSDDDYSALRGSLPEPESVNDSTTLSVPGYLVRMTAEFRIDGQVVATAPGLTMGTDLIGETEFSDTAESISLSPDVVTVGEYHEFLVIGHGVSRSSVANTKNRLESVSASLQQFELADKHAYLEPLFHSVLLSYFLQNEISDVLAAKAQRIVEYRLPSIAKATTRASVTYSHGVPRRVDLVGLVTDVDRLQIQVQAANASKQDTTNFTIAAGIRGSFYEGKVFEHLLTPPDGQRPVGASSVSVMAAANAAQIPVHLFTPASAGDVASLNLPQEARSAIATGLAAGKTAIAPEQQVVLGDWYGAAWIIIDPETGSGAYQVSGGFDGFDLLDVNLAGFAGFFDGYSKSLDHTRMFLRESESLYPKYVKAVKAANILAKAGLIYDLVQVLRNAKANGLDGYQIFGQLATILFEFAVVSWLTAAIIAAGVGVLGAGLGVLVVCVLMAALMNAFNAVYFSRRRTVDDDLQLA